VVRQIVPGAGSGDWKSYVTDSRLLRLTGSDVVITERRQLSYDVYNLFLSIDKKITCT